MMAMDCIKTWLRSSVFGLLGLCFLIVPECVLGHDSPGTVIAKLTATMAHDGVSADLFFQRACEFRAIRYYKRAAYDLTQALALDNSMVAARLELARLLLQNSVDEKQFEANNPLLGNPMETIAFLTSNSDSATRTAAIALRGEIYMSKHQWKEAIDDFSAALLVEPSLAWFIYRAEAQQELELYEDSISGLQEAYALTKSPVVRKALCDTLIAVARQPPQDSSSSLNTTTVNFYNGNSYNVNSYLEEASKIIDEELAENRLKSSWQIRSGQVFLLRGDSKNARQAFLNAIEELNDRLETPQPDPALVQDCAKAEALLADCMKP